MSVDNLVVTGSGFIGSYRTASLRLKQSLLCLECVEHVRSHNLGSSKEFGGRRRLEKVRAAQRRIFALTCLAEYIRSD